MQYEEITNYMEDIFSLSLKKCGNYDDAEDLTQEVLTTALGYNREVEHVRAWLVSVLNHKYCDMLRRKYRLPTVSIDLVSEEIEWKSASPAGQEPEEDEKPDDAAVRREVAYLADKYREVTIRHYLNGEKVQQIAKSLHIPKGTVLSRLSAGRETMRKGLEHMEQYEKQSFQPQRLELSCHGRPGMQWEPWSLVEGDLLRQNILIIAYEKPVTCVEIARALGIPAAYIEQAVDKLVKAQLMVRTGNRVFTDFQIHTVEQTLKALEADLAFVDRHFEELCRMVDAYLEELRQIRLESPLRESQKRKLEHFFVMSLFDNSLSRAIRQLVPAKEQYPERPDGGCWIAVGNRYPADMDFEHYLPAQYCYGGERRSCFENFLGARSITLHVYDSQPDLNRYERGPVELHDDHLVKLLYLLHSQKTIEETGFEVMYLQDIPHLVKCGVLRMEENQPQVDIPVISQAEWEKLNQAKSPFFTRMTDWLVQELQEHLPKVRSELPKHLDNRVAEFRKCSCFAIPEAFLKKAKTYGFLDPEARPPMVLVTEEAGR